jgi:hypothetical protein
VRARLQRVQEQPQVPVQPQRVPAQVRVRPQPVPEQRVRVRQQRVQAQVQARPQRVPEQQRVQARQQPAPQAWVFRRPAVRQPVLPPEPPQQADWRAAARRQHR